MNLLARPTRSITRDSIALTLAVSLLLLLGCTSRMGRTVATATLEPMSFEHESAPITGTIELCLTPRLRMRQWNVAAHPYKIELGSRAALNLEILAKSAFSNVIVTFERACGSSTNHPTLAATILAANRDWDSLMASEQRTEITMEFELAGVDERPIWMATTKGEVSQPPSAYARQKTRAAEAFGEAIALALREAFRELVESKAVRDAFEAPPVGADSTASPKAS